MPGLLQANPNKRCSWWFPLDSVLSSEGMWHFCTVHCSSGNLVQGAAELQPCSIYWPLSSIPSSCSFPPPADQLGCCLLSPAAATARGKPLLYHCAAEGTFPKDLAQSRPSSDLAKWEKSFKNWVNFSKRKGNVNIFPFLFHRLRNFTRRKVTWFGSFSMPRCTPRKVKATNQK